MKRIEIVKKGVCKICGCTHTTPCFTRNEGCCWWMDENQTLCSHCYYGFYEPQLEKVLKIERSIHEIN